MRPFAVGNRIWREAIWSLIVDSSDERGRLMGVQGQSYLYLLKSCVKVVRAIVVVGGIVMPMLCKVMFCSEVSSPSIDRVNFQSISS